MDNLDIYNKVRKVPKEALKPIMAGRLKGKSDINPMWRLQVLTETFGPCGFGWKYEIVKQWIEEGGNGEKAAFVNINLYVKQNDIWSDGIPGTGGSSFVANEKNGPYVSDECFKMALTDAISVSCKALGVAADVYWEHGSKYTLGQDMQNKQSNKQEPPKQDIPKEDTKPEKSPLEQRLTTIYMRCKNGFGWDSKLFAAWLTDMKESKNISSTQGKEMKEGDVILNTNLPKEWIK